MTISQAFPLEPTPIHVPDGVLDDLGARLALTRPPLDDGNGDWSYGVPDSYLRELIAHWGTATTGARLRPPSTPMSRTR